MEQKKKERRKEGRKERKKEKNHVRRVASWQGVPVQVFVMPPTRGESCGATTGAPFLDPVI